jgi:hypothetical protein
MYDTVQTIMWNNEPTFVFTFYYLHITYSVRYSLGVLWYQRRQRQITLRTAAKMNMILRYTFNLPISQKKLQDLMQYKYIESEDLEREHVSA